MALVTSEQDEHAALFFTKTGIERPARRMVDEQIDASVRVQIRRSNRVWVRIDINGQRRVFHRLEAAATVSEQDRHVVDVVIRDDEVRVRVVVHVRVRDVDRVLARIGVARGTQPALSVTEQHNQPLSRADDVSPPVPVDVERDRLVAPVV